MRRVASLCACVAAVACGDGTDTDIRFLRVDTRSVSVDQLDSAQILVRLLDARGEVVTDPSIEYRSLNTTIVRVNSDGWIVSTGLAGTTEVEVAAGPRFDTVAVAVRRVADRIEVAESPIQIRQFNRTLLQARVVDRAGEHINGGFSYFGFGQEIDIADPTTTQCDGPANDCWQWVSFISGAEPGSTQVNIQSAGVSVTVPVVVFRDPAIVERHLTPGWWGSPVSVAAGAVGPMVLAMGDGRIVTLDAAGGLSGIGNVRGYGQTGRRLAYTADGRGLFVMNTREVKVFEDLVEQPHVFEVPGPIGEGGIAEISLSPDGNSLLVAQWEPDSIGPAVFWGEGARLEELDRATLAIQRSIDLLYVRRLSTGGGGTKLYGLTVEPTSPGAQSNDYYVNVIDWPALTISDRVFAGSVGHLFSNDNPGFTVGPAERFVYISSSAGVDVVELATGAITRTTFPARVTSSAVMDDGDHLLVTLEETNTPIGISSVTERPGQLVVLRLPDMVTVATVRTAGIPQTVTEIDATTLAVGNAHDWLDIVSIPELGN